MEKSNPILKISAVIGIILITMVIALILSTKGNLKINSDNIPKTQFSSKSSFTNWPVFTNPQFRYSISYPEEFAVDDRGKIGSLEQVVGFTTKTKDKTITVVRVEVSNTSPPKSQTRTEGKDGDNNTVITYSIPLSPSQTITIVGTIYPAVGSEVVYNNIIDQMVKSIKINK